MKLKMGALVCALTGMLVFDIACNHPLQPTADQLCEPDKAVDVGMLHGARGIQPIDNVAQVCALDLRPTITAKYLEGHAVGVEIAMEAARKDTCGYDQGYKLGVNDAQAGRYMRLGLFDICYEDTRSASETGYREGYGLVLANQPKVVVNNHHNPAGATGQTGAGTGGAAQMSRCSGGRCALTVGIEDVCYRSSRLEFRFFDPDRNLVWPSNSQIYTSPGVNQRATETLECFQGNRICFGAQEGQSYWGVGIDGKKGCTDCCITCEDLPEPYIWRIGC